MSLYQAFEVAKIGIFELQKNLGIEISKHLQECVDQKNLPQNKKNYSKKWVCMRELLLFENHCYYYFSRVTVVPPKIKWLYIFPQMSDLDETKSNLGVFWPVECDANIWFVPTSFNFHLQNISPIGMMANFSRK